MFTPHEFVTVMQSLDVTHVVGIPDSTLGPWFPAIDQSSEIRLIRVCREGEAWAVAGGLHLGGARPVVVIQCTGLFESGDSLRNAIHDYGVPLFGIVGYRSLLSPQAVDSARDYTEPILRAWGIETVLIDSTDRQGLLAEHYRSCRVREVPGVALIAESRA
jgi:sulfopyruvate decarboxylase TPP-binding subunit